MAGNGPGPRRRVKAPLGGETGTPNTQEGLSMSTFVASHDIISGVDLPGELADIWQDVEEMTCGRCGDPSNVTDSGLCGPCERYTARAARFKTEEAPHAAV